MAALLDHTVPRTFDALLARFGGGACRGVRLEAWLFEGADARRAAELRLAEAGVQARIRGAYKPLVHWFLEDAPPGIIRTPAHPAAAPGRFRLEAYPLARLLPGAEPRFEPGDLPLHHRVVLDHAGGRSEHSVFAPNRVRVDHLGRAVLCPTGWLRTAGEGVPVVAPDGVPGGTADGVPGETEFEAVFQAAMDAVTTYSWSRSAPPFDALEIRVDTGGIERALGPGCGHISTREALHEDLYFSASEWFRHRAGRPLGDRTLRLGQIMPDLRPTPGPSRVRVALRRHGAAPAEPTPTEAEAPVPLDAAQTPLHRGGWGRNWPRSAASGSRRAPGRGGTCPLPTSPAPVPGWSSPPGSTPMRRAAWWARCGRRGLWRGGACGSSPCPWKTRTVTPCTAACAGSTPATCTTPRATWRWATTCRRERPSPGSRRTPGARHCAGRTPCCT